MERKLQYAVINIRTPDCPSDAIAWFFEREDAEEYASWLTSLGQPARVVYRREPAQPWHPDGVGL